MRLGQLLAAKGRLERAPTGATVVIQYDDAVTAVATLADASPATVRRQTWPSVRKEISLVAASGAYSIHTVLLMLRIVGFEVDPVRWHQLVGRLQHQLVVHDTRHRSSVQPSMSIDLTDSPCDEPTETTHVPLGPSEPAPGCSNNLSVVAAVPADPPELRQAEQLQLALVDIEESNPDPCLQRLLPLGVYQNMDREGLLNVVLARDTCIRALRNELHATKKQLARLKAEDSEDASALAPHEQQYDLNHHFQVDRVGKNKTRLSVKSRFALAIRRNLTNVAARDLGAAILEDVSHQSINRYEIECGAALVGSFRAFHADCYAEKPQLIVHSIRCDATNSSVWQQSKLHGLELTTSCLDDLSMANSITDIAADQVSRTQFADPLPLYDSSAAGTHAMIRKQIAGLGCVPWDIVDPDTAPPLENQLGELPTDIGIRLWLLTTDGGPDQVKCRRIIKHETMMSPTDVVFDLNCLLHNVHLIMRSGLAIADAFAANARAPFKYYSALAKLMHLWREKARAVFLAWQRLHGGSAAVKHARRVPPKCLSGRWGSVAVVEQFIVSAGREQIKSVMLDVLGVLDALKDDHVAMEAMERSSAIDDPQLEETAAHRSRLGRWKSDTVKTLEDGLFWAMVSILSCSHPPLQHHLHFVQKFECQRDALGRFVCGKARSILSDLETCFADTSWLSDSIVDEIPLFQMSALIDLHVSITLHHAAAYFRRFVDACEQTGA
jgi:hypothetical protein